MHEMRVHDSEMGMIWKYEAWAIHRVINKTSYTMCGHLYSLVRLNATYAGCYDVNGIDSSRKLWSSARNSPARCVRACRQQGYTLAELQVIIYIYIY